MGEETTAPETGAPEQTAGPETEPAAQTETTTPIQLPDDHPLVKSLKATREELKTLRDAEKTELQRATDDLKSEKTRADGLETELLQLRSALKHGIDLEDVDLLGTGTAEEIEARAKRLAARGAASKKQGNKVTREGTNTTAAKGDDRAFVRDLFASGG